MLLSWLFVLLFGDMVSCEKKTWSDWWRSLGLPSCFFVGFFQALQQKNPRVQPLVLRCSLTNRMSWLNHIENCHFMAWRHDFIAYVLRNLCFGAPKFRGPGLRRARRAMAILRATSRWVMVLRGVRRRDHNIAVIKAGPTEWNRFGLDFLSKPRATLFWVVNKNDQY